MATEKQQQANSQQQSRDVSVQRSGGAAATGTRTPSLWSVSPRELLMSSPFELMRRMSEDMERLFGSMSPWPMSSPSQGSLWSPAVEVAEKDGSVVVRAELPGMSKDDVKVELTPEGLLIEGERKQTHEERGERGMVRSEWRYGRFSRLIPLPDEANVEQAKAQFRDGILEVTVPIPEEKRRRREIPIESGGGQSSQAA